MDFDELYSRLNEEQKQAVDTIEGPVQVIAGPGTGKTQVLAMRIANILNKTQVDPHNILALTFTESGVKAMRQRLKQIIGRAAYYVNIYTFHSFCSRVISEFPEKFSYTRELKAIDDIQKFEVVRSIIDRNEFKHLVTVNNPYFFLYSIISAIADLKREYVKPTDLSEYVARAVEELDAEGLEETTYKYKQLSTKIYKWEELLVIYEEYEKELEARGFYDFEDMILFAVEKLKEDDELLYYYQEMFQYFLVDEYQDTNSAQNELVKILASFHESPNIFAVGDDDQSIFRFQGASLENILLFRKWYPDSTNIILKKNYRSSQVILDAANSIISNNELRVETDKHLESQTGYEDKKISKYSFQLGEQENYFLVKAIERLIEDGVDLEEVAIIMRDNADREDVIDFLIKAGIPYHIYGGGNVIYDVWIRKILSLMKVVADPFDDFNIYDVLTLDCFNIPQVDIFKLSKIASKKKKKYFEVINDKKLNVHLSEEGLSKLVAFFEMVLGLQRSETNMNFIGFFEVMLNESGFLEMVMGRPDQIEILNRINSLFAFITKQVEINRKLTLNDFLSKLDIMQEHRIPIKELEWLSSAKAVQVLTAHKAKGLEFEYVFMPKCFDGKWGNKRSPRLLSLPDELLKATDLSKKEKNEDERRLFYTSVTRAKKEIFISFAENYHNSTGNNKILSQFAEEIDQSLVVEKDCGEIDITEVSTLQYKEPDEVYFEGNESEYIKQVLLGSFKLSPTSLSTYMTCKRKFLYDSILKLPTVKPPAMYLGDAIHKALERLFIYFKDNDAVPPLNWVTDVFEKRLEKTEISENDFNQAREKGLELVSGWYEYYKDQFSKPAYVEYYFGNRDIRYEDVPLTGKIDKIEVTDIKNKSVKLIDYKSGAPRSRNDIMGHTQSSDGAVFRQLYFYKLLCDLDPTFKYLAASGEVDFVKPNPTGKYKTEEFEFDEETLNELKELIVNTYHEMLSLDFSKTDDLTTCASCQFRDICKR